MTDPLWTPSPERVEAARLTEFLRQVNTSQGLSLDDYDGLYEWSIDNLPRFWEEVWSYADLQAERQPIGTLLEGDEMTEAEWFRGAELNFAENLLRYRDDRDALVFVQEDGTTERITYKELARKVALLTRFLQDQGVWDGDRIAVYLPNRIEAVITMLAASSLGAIYTSCSPDFGLQAVLDRFKQVEPKVLITCDGYKYNGERYDILKRVQNLLLEIYTIERVVIVPTVHANPSRAGLRGALMWDEAMDREGVEDNHFDHFPFDHPLYILYSSGTTGEPKAIVHGQGGTLIQHAKELMLHCDIGRDDVVFYYTTTGWMMWNWLISCLFTGATCVIYDGSPAHPDMDALWRMAEREGVTVFGTSPKYLRACANAGLEPGEDHDLSRLRTVLSTGAPLSPELFEWVYDHVKSDLLLASIAGGTDIVSCFMGGSPISPVYAGEIQKRALGMAVEAWNDDAEPVVGEKGELVCTRPFPSMPVEFWNDPGHERYHAAYFEHFPGVWRHGDLIEITEQGGVIVYGRSDATLNRGGVRIGTAEIYRVVEDLDAIDDSLAIGRPFGADLEVVLFVVLAGDAELDDALQERIRTDLRDQASPRHVPDRILAVSEIPRTRSGKKVEMAVTDLAEGYEVDNRAALENPEALDELEELLDNLPQG